MEVPELLVALRGKLASVSDAGQRRRLISQRVSSLLLSGPSCDDEQAAELVLHGILDLWSAIRGDVRTQLRASADRGAPPSWIVIVKVWLIDLLEDATSAAPRAAPDAATAASPIYGLVRQRSHEWRGVEGALEALLVVLQQRLAPVSEADVERAIDAACRCLSHTQLTVRAAAVKTLGEAVRWYRSAASAVAPVPLHPFLSGGAGGAGVQGTAAGLPPQAVSVLGRVLDALAKGASGGAAGPPMSAYHAEALLDTAAHLLQGQQVQVQRPLQQAQHKRAAGAAHDLTAVPLPPPPLPQPAGGEWLVPTEWWAVAWEQGTPAAADGGAPYYSGPPLSALLVPTYLAHPASTVRQMASKVLACIALRSLPLARSVARACAAAVDELPPPPSPAGALDSGLGNAAGAAGGSSAGGGLAAAAAAAAAAPTSARSLDAGPSRSSPPPSRTTGGGGSVATPAAAHHGGGSLPWPPPPSSTASPLHAVGAGWNAATPIVAWHLREGALLVFDLLLSRLLRHHLRAVVAARAAPWAHAPASFTLTHIGAVHAGSRPEEDDDDARAHDAFIDRCAADWADAAVAAHDAVGGPADAVRAMLLTPLCQLTCCAGEEPVALLDEEEGGQELRRGGEEGSSYSKGAAARSVAGCFPWRAVWLQVASCVQHSVFELTRMADALLPLLTTSLAWAHAALAVASPVQLALHRAACGGSSSGADAMGRRGRLTSSASLELPGEGGGGGGDGRTGLSACTVLELCLEGTQEAVKTRDAHRCMAFARALFVLYSVLREWEGAALATPSTPTSALTPSAAALSIAGLLARLNDSAQVLCVGAPTDAVLVLGLEVLCLASTSASLASLAGQGLRVEQSVAVVIDRASRVMSVALAGGSQPLSTSSVPPTPSRVGSSRDLSRESTATSSPRAAALRPTAAMAAGVVALGPLSLSRGDDGPTSAPASSSESAIAPATAVLWPPSMWPGVAAIGHAFLTPPPQPPLTSPPPLASPPLSAPASSAPLQHQVSTGSHIVVAPDAWWLPASFCFVTTERVRGLILEHRLRRREHLRLLSAVRQASLQSEHAAAAPAGAATASSAASASSASEEKAGERERLRGLGSSTHNVARGGGFVGAAATSGALLSPSAGRPAGGPGAAAALTTPLRGGVPAHVFERSGGSCESGGSSDPDAYSGAMAAAGGGGFSAGGEGTTRRGVILLEQSPNPLLTPNTHNCMTSPHTLLASSDRFFPSGHQGPSSAHSSGTAGQVGARLPSLPEERAARAFPITDTSARSEGTTSTITSPTSNTPPPLAAAASRYSALHVSTAAAPVVTAAPFPEPFASRLHLALDPLSAEAADAQDASAAVGDSGPPSLLSSKTPPAASDGASLDSFRPSNSSTGGGMRALQEAPSFLLQSYRSTQGFNETPVADGAGESSLSGPQEAAGAVRARRSRRVQRERVRAAIVELDSRAAVLEESKGFDEDGKSAEGKDDGSDDDEDADVAGDSLAVVKEADDLRVDGSSGPPIELSADVVETDSASPSQLQRHSTSPGRGRTLTPGGLLPHPAHIQPQQSSGGTSSPFPPARGAASSLPHPSPSLGQLRSQSASHLVGPLPAPSSAASTNGSVSAAWSLRASALLSATAAALVPFIPAVAAALAHTAAATLASPTAAATLHIEAHAELPHRPGQSVPSHPPVLASAMSAQSSFGVGPAGGGAVVSSSSGSGSSPGGGSGGSTGSATPDSSAHLLLQLMGLCNAWACACLAKVPMPLSPLAGAAAAAAAPVTARGAPAAMPGSASARATLTSTGVSQPLQRQVQSALTSRTSASGEGAAWGGPAPASASAAIIPHAMLRPCLLGLRAVSDALRQLLQLLSAPERRGSSRPVMVQIAAATAFALALLLHVAADAAEGALAAEKDLLSTAGPSALAGPAAVAVEDALWAVQAAVGLSELLRDARRGAAGTGVPAILAPQPLAAMIQASLRRCTTAARALDFRVPPPRPVGGAWGPGGLLQAAAAARALAAPPPPPAASAVTPLLWRGHVLHKVHVGGGNAAALGLGALLGLAALTTAAPLGLGLTARSSDPQGPQGAPSARSVAALGNVSDRSEMAGSSVAAAVPTIVTYPGVPPVSVVDKGVSKRPSSGGSAGDLSCVGLLDTPTSSISSAVGAAGGASGGDGGGGGQWDDWDDASSEASESDRSIDSGTAASLVNSEVGVGLAMLRLRAAADDLRSCLGLVTDLDDHMSVSAR